MIHGSGRQTGWVEDIDDGPETDLRALEARAMDAMANVFRMQSEAEYRERQEAIRQTAKARATALQSDNKPRKRKAKRQAELLDDPSSSELDPDSDFDPEEHPQENDSDYDSDYDEANESESPSSDDSILPPSKRTKTRYRISKYTAKPRTELEALDKCGLIDRLSELQGFVDGNKSKISRRQLLNTVLQLEDHLHQVKNSVEDKVDTEDSSDTASPYLPRDGADSGALRGVVGLYAKSDKDAPTEPAPARPNVQKPIGNNIFKGIIQRFFPTKTPQKDSPHTSPIAKDFELPPDETRNFTLKKWTMEDYQRETNGRLPFIDPEAKRALQYTKTKSKEDYEKFLKYAKGEEWNPDDLALLTIDTLPCNGRKAKPTHGGPQSAAYYQRYTNNLFASIAKWVQKYLVPDDDTVAININDPEVIDSVRGAVRKLDYFLIQDFIPKLSPEGKPLELPSEPSRFKRQVFFQYIFYSILNDTIWRNWLYGFDDSVTDAVLKQGGLTRRDKNTEIGHQVRGRWFVDNIRRKPTNMNARSLNDRVNITTTLRQTFVPLLKFKDRTRRAGDRRMPTSAERELSLIVADAQALQFMFQSEYMVHLMIFDEPDTPFNDQWMINAADRGAMREIDAAPVPGRPGKMTSLDRIAVAYQPALFIDTETLIQERAVVM
ncbi:hypothetical protein DRE_02227 [Drechslerella stenobrocha 248]|uniref:Uncharacterized protein n=1 Tax=Drechslerella stenobrocha 248 TaxID=1043628 RepID=W7I862_9PEZI|nr:hypothetical protein DRE_02227 [Drechslerella stenobrocha 248]